MTNAPDPSFFCDSMDDWAKACMTPLPTDDEHTRAWREEFSAHWVWIRRAIRKSNLLHRLLYQGEKIRTGMCPIHKGRWSGCLPLEDMTCGGVCANGHNVTGWLRDSQEGSK